MASTVRRRLTAMRASVTMALFGLLAGLGIEAQASLSSPPAPDAHSASTKIAHNSIGSAQVKLHSLLFSDLKEHQVPSYKEYKESVSKIMSALGKIDVANLVHKIDVYDKTAADAAFMHKGDTADNALKIDGLSTDQLVQGHGQVITGSMSVGPSMGDLFVLIGLLRVSAVDPTGGPAAQVTLTNTSDQNITLNEGNNVPSSIIKPGGSSSPIAMGDGSVMPIQIIGGGGQVITLTLSSFTGGVHTLVGQAVVGTP